MFFYDGDSLVEELDTSGTPNILRRYIPGNSVDDTLGWYEGGGLGTPNWLHADEQGAVIATTDSSGTATPYAYSVTGESKGGWSASAPAFRYTGQVAIASAAIYYYKARMYDPALGRFLQTDPVGYQAGMNLYAYALNDSVNSSDPFGLATCIQGGSISFDDGKTWGAFSPVVVDCPDTAEALLEQENMRALFQRAAIIPGAAEAVQQANTNNIGKSGDGNDSRSDRACKTGQAMQQLGQAGEVSSGFALVLALLVSAAVPEIRAAALLARIANAGGYISTGIRGSGALMAGDKRDAGLAALGLIAGKSAEYLNAPKLLQGPLGSAVETAAGSRKPDNC